ncbi:MULTISPECIES: LysR family transcriptional regulator [Halomonadaceae]|uniref:LysR family transcriptional regulator n=1 Tax=Halomonadaceae TaxID=28256 RepID=UPI0015994A26|nr:MULTISPECIES: LysR family transcriptional regulator [Halomonas]QJQ94838.1 LysR family transcriptional regulator [Halomonas sp. PA5]
MPLLLPALRYFEEVARHGSLRKAADHLHVAASAVNRQILKLEDELGVPLFERLPRGMRLSPAGEIILYKIRQWQRDERQLLEYLGDIRGSGCAEIRIATIESMTDRVLPMVLRRFSQRFPRVRFIINTGVTSSILEQVITGDADIGICMNPPLTRRVRFVEKVSLTFGAVISPSHPLASKPSIKLQDCNEFPVIQPNAEMFSGSTLQRLIESTNLELAPVAHCNRILSIKSLARSGLGVAFLTRLDIARELEQGELIFKPLTDKKHIKSTLSLCVAADHPLPMATTVILEQVRQAITNIEDSTEYSSGPLP